MHNAAQTYARTAQTTRSGKDLEAFVLKKAALRLQMVRDDFERNRSQLDDALSNNRKLWVYLVSAVTEASSPLPLEIRNNIVNLGLFIFNRTIELTTDPRPEALDVLISINRNIAEGLEGSPAAAPTPQAA